LLPSLLSGLSSLSVVVAGSLEEVRGGEETTVFSVLTNVCSEKE
jgi:hypothetical protein